MLKIHTSRFPGEAHRCTQPTKPSRRQRKGRKAFMWVKKDKTFRGSLQGVELQTVAIESRVPIEGFLLWVLLRALWFPLSKSWQRGSKISVRFGLLEMSSVSRRELVLVSAAAGALGGGLVALAFSVGGWSRRRRSNEDASQEVDGSMRWLKGGEDVGISRETPPAPSASNGVFLDANDFSSSKLHSSRQSLYLSAQNSEIEGFEDVGTLLKVGNLDPMIDHPASTTPLSLTIADNPDPYNPSKRKGYVSWDDYFMAIAFLSARRSKDPSRQVGACIVSQDRVILGIGYNGFPRGCSDDNLPWAKKSATGDPLQTKYPYVCHAEVNAILNKNHASASGQRLYVTLFPCNECAKMIIQAGIAEVVYYTDKGAHVDNDAGGTEPAYVASRRLLSMAGIKVWQHQPADKMLVLEFR